MTDYIFGYGSLMHPRSLSRALGRDVEPAELRLVRVTGLRRDWGLRDVVHSRKLGRNINAAFLDVRPLPGAWVNGTLVSVSAAEQAKIRLREKNYDVLNITSQVEEELGVGDVVLTSAGKAQHREPAAGLEEFAMRRYMRLIDEALGLLGQSAVGDFAQSTDAVTVPLLDGEYVFVDPEQAALV
jgi:hypothetical protein